MDLGLKNHVSKSIRRKVMSVGVVFTIVRSNFLRIYFQKIINNFFPVIFRRKNLILMLISIKFRVDWYTTWPYSDNFEKNQNFMAAILKLRRGCHFEIFFKTFFFATCLIMIFDNFLRGTPFDIPEKVSLCATLLIVHLPSNRHGTNGTKSIRLTKWITMYHNIQWAVGWIPAILYHAWSWSGLKSGSIALTLFHFSSL